MLYITQYKLCDSDRRNIMPKLAFSLLWGDLGDETNKNKTWEFLLNKITVRFRKYTKI